jgi:two-component system, cell cycle response regulator CpdR
VARILVVDDDPLFLAIMSRTLDKARHDVVAVSDCSKAIDLVQKEAFDALVCGFVVADPAALHVIRHARHHAPVLAIIAIAGGKPHGKSLHADVVNMARAVGATAVVKKPFELHDFVATVEAALAPQKASVTGS